MIAPGEERWREIFERLDALVFTGGGDVDPALYDRKQHPELYGIDRARDETEIAFARAGVEARRPALAICRGRRVVNVALGGTLIEHLLEKVRESVPRRGVGPPTWTLTISSEKPSLGPDNRPRVAPPPCAILLRLLVPRSPATGPERAELRVFAPAPLEFVGALRVTVQDVEGETVAAFEGEPQSVAVVMPHDRKPAMSGVLEE